MPLKRVLYFFIEVVVFILFMAVLLSHSSLLVDPSKLYSTSIAHRLQTDALMHGHLSLSPRPFGYLFDFVWAGHGLQQNWGLGVSLLRFPFEWVSHQLGFGAFPDRVVLLFYLIFTVFLLNITLRSVIEVFSEGVSNIIKLMLRWYLIAWIFFSPAMGGLIQREIDVYNETVLYGCLCAYVILCLLWVYIKNLEVRIFIILCLMSGFACLVRLTVIYYGLSAVLIASIFTYQYKRNIRLIIIGLFCFGLGVAIELWCNYVRFGLMLPFGSPESSNMLISYASRFWDAPFNKEHFFNAFKELLGGIFFNNSWQSHIFRGRWNSEYSPFNATHFIVLVFGIIIYLYFLSFKFIKRIISEGLVGNGFGLISLTLAWGLISFGALFSFYFRFTAITFRYFSEFSCALNALFIALILYAFFNLNFWFKKKCLLILFLIFLMGVFYITNRKFFESDNQSMGKYYGIVAKLGFWEIGSDGAPILSKLIENGILDDISFTEVGVYQEPSLIKNKEKIRKIAGNHFGEIWRILQQSNQQNQCIDKKGVEKLVARFNHDILLRPYLPEISYCGHSYPSAGLKFQYVGWNINKDCSVRAVTSAILPSSNCVTLNYTIQNIKQLPEIQVKRDTIWLKLVDSQRIVINTSGSYGAEMTQVFCTDASIKNSVAQYSIGWVTADQLDKVREEVIPVKLNWLSVAEQCRYNNY